MGPARALLDGGRHHFQHGPIDLIIGADGDAGAVGMAIDECWIHFQSILGGLASELRELKRPMAESPRVSGNVAARMVTAAARFPGVFVTPMAAVAGAVADEMIGFFRRNGITRAYVNNGGDIALHLTAGQHFQVGMAGERDPKPWKPQSLAGKLTLTHADAVGGIATSGWRGRSFSLGIADSVTVLAADAALADVAATLVANAVDIDSPAVQRRPAAQLKDDTDLGERPVTVAVGDLTPREIDMALDAGLRVAERYARDGLVQGAALLLCGHSRQLGGAAVAA